LSFYYSVYSVVKRHLVNLIFLNLNMFRQVPSPKYILFILIIFVVKPNKVFLFIVLSQWSCGVNVLYIDTKSRTGLKTWNYLLTSFPELQVERRPGMGFLSEGHPAPDKQQDLHAYLGGSQVAHVCYQRKWIFNCKNKFLTSPCLRNGGSLGDNPQNWTLTRNPTTLPLDDVLKESICIYIQYYSYSW
jgi:hypothetical protein